MRAVKGCICESCSKHNPPPVVGRWRTVRYLECDFCAKIRTIHCSVLLLFLPKLESIFSDPEYPLCLSHRDCIMPKSHTSDGSNFSIWSFGAFCTQGTVPDPRRCRVPCVQKEQRSSDIEGGQKSSSFVDQICRVEKEQFVRSTLTLVYFMSCCENKCMTPVPRFWWT